MNNFRTAPQALNPLERGRIQTQPSLVLCGFANQKAGPGSPPRAGALVLGRAWNAAQPVAALERGTINHPPEQRKKPPFIS